MSGLELTGNTISKTGEYLPAVYIDKIYLDDTGVVVDASIFVPHLDIELAAALGEGDITYEGEADETSYVSALDKNVHYYIMIIKGSDSDDTEEIYEQIIAGKASVWRAYYDYAAKSDAWFAMPEGVQIVLFEFDPLSETPITIFDEAGQEFLKYMEQSAAEIDNTGQADDTYPPSYVWDWASSYIDSVHILAFSSTFEAPGYPDGDDYVDELSDPALLDAQTGDISYEKVWEDGTLASRLQTEYVDPNGSIYDQIPLQAMNSFYYKINRITHEEIVEVFETLIEEYRETFKLDELEDNMYPKLRNAINVISTILEVRGEEADLLPQLNAARGIFPDKSLALPVGKFYKNLRNRIFNVDKLIRDSVRLRKKIVYNGKIVDRRAQVVSTDLDPSWVDYEDCEMVYSPDTWTSPVDGPMMETYLRDWRGEYHADYDADWLHILINGYIFFDYEKALRTNSYISKYLDVGKLEDWGLPVPYNLFRIENMEIYKDYWSAGSEYDYGELTIGSYLDDNKNYPVTHHFNVDEVGTKDINTLNPSSAGEPMATALSCTMLEDTFSHLLVRNFVDVTADDWSDIDNYRLLAFSLMDYVRDADQLNGGLDYVPDGIVTVNMTDTTLKILKTLEAALLKVIIEYAQYVERCQAICSANEDTDLFNTFFADALMEEYEDNMTNAPWIRAPLIMLMIQDILTDYWNGSKQEILDRAAVITSQINPVNGNIISVEEFLAAMEESFTIFSEISDDIYGLGLGDAYYCVDDPEGEMCWWEIEIDREYTCTIDWPDMTTWSGNELIPLEMSECDDLAYEPECMVNTDCASGYYCNIINEERPWLNKCEEYVVDEGDDEYTAEWDPGYYWQVESIIYSYDLGANMSDGETEALADAMVTMFDGYYPTLWYSGVTDEGACDADHSTYDDIETKVTSNTGGFVSLSECDNDCEVSFVDNFVNLSSDETDGNCNLYYWNRFFRIGKGHSASGEYEWYFVESQCYYNGSPSKKCGYPPNKITSESDCCTTDYSYSDVQALVVGNAEYVDEA